MEPGLSINSALDSTPIFDWSVASSGATVHWTHVSRSEVGVVLRQPCGNSSSAARRDVPADAVFLPDPHAQVRDRSMHCPNLGDCARYNNAT